MAFARVARGSHELSFLKKTTIMDYIRTVGTQSRILLGLACRDGTNGTQRLLSYDTAAFFIQLMLSRFPTFIHVEEKVAQ